MHNYVKQEKTIKEAAISWGGDRTTRNDLAYVLAWFPASLTLSAPPATGFLLSRPGTLPP